MRVTLKKAFNPKHLHRGRSQEGRSCSIGQKRSSPRRGPSSRAYSRRSPKWQVRCRVPVPHLLLRRQVRQGCRAPSRPASRRNPAICSTKMLLTRAVSWLTPAIFRRGRQGAGDRRRSGRSQMHGVPDLGLSLEFDEQRPADALLHLEKAVAKFPQAPQGYMLSRTRTSGCSTPRRTRRARRRSSCWAGVEADLEQVPGVRPERAPRQRRSSSCSSRSPGGTRGPAVTSGSSRPAPARAPARAARPRYAEAASARSTAGCRHPGAGAVKVRRRCRFTLGPRPADCRAPP